MFTIADIRNIAIQIERNGEETYRSAAAMAGDAEIEQILTRMADDEQRHAQWFEKIQDTKELSPEQREMEAVGKMILQEMVKDRTFSLEERELSTVDNLAELLDASQGFEKDTILFYEMLCGFIDDPSTKEQLQSIIAEERSHFEQLEKLVGESPAEA